MKAAVVLAGLKPGATPNQDRPKVVALIKWLEGQPGDRINLEAMPFERIPKQCRTAGFDIGDLVTQAAEFDDDGDPKGGSYLPIPGQAGLVIGHTPFIGGVWDRDARAFVGEADLLVAVELPAGGGFICSTMSSKDLVAAKSFAEPLAEQSIVNIKASAEKVLALIDKKIAEGQGDTAPILGGAEKMLAAMLGQN